MKKYTITKVAFVIILLYMLQFIVIPIFYFPTSNEGTGILIISTVLLTVTGMFIISDKLYYWLISNILYSILIYFYHPKGAYGVGMFGLFEASTYSWDVVPFSIVILTILLIIVQFAVWIVVKIIKYTFRKSKQKITAHNNFVDKV